MTKHDNQVSESQRATRSVAQRAPAPAVSAWDAQVAASPQRMLGNQALARRASTIQTKLTVGPAVDNYEREADQVASQVVKGIQAQQANPVGDVQRHGDEDELQMKRVNISTIQRHGDEEEMQMKRVNISTIQRHNDEEDEIEAQEKRIDGSAVNVQRGIVQRQEEEDEIEAQEKRINGSAVNVQRMAGAGAEGGEVDEKVESTIKSQRGGGSPLPDATRSAMESGFGADFGNVRIHQGAGADTLNRSLSARAFTTGSDIFFRSGEYDPGSQHGQELLAHELTHVVQQGGATQHM